MPMSAKTKNWKKPFSKRRKSIKSAYLNKWKIRDRTQKAAGELSFFLFGGGSNRAPFPVFLMMRIREKRTVTQNKEGIAGKEGAPENVAPQKGLSEKYLK